MLGSRRAGAAVTLLLCLTGCLGQGRSAAPAPLVTRLAPTGGWLSGAHVLSQSPDAVSSWGAWRHRAVTVTTDYVPDGSWSSLEKPEKLARAWAGVPVNVICSVPAWPRTGGDLAAGAAGKYDAHYRRFAQTLVASGQGEATVRFAWEFNGTHYRWQVQDAQQAALYAAMWRHFAKALRSVSGADFQLDWSIANNAPQRFDLTAAYPGDDGVDVIGNDVYDWDFGRANATAAQRWQDLRTQNGTGLDWQAAFAAAHHKELGFSEWAAAIRDFDGSAVGGGDEPAFITHMHEWFAGHATAYDVYFTTDMPTTNEFHDLRDGRFPTAATTYQQLFGRPPAAG